MSKHNGRHEREERALRLLKLQVTHREKRCLKTSIHAAGV